MILQLNPIKDNFVENCFKRAVKELNAFFKINWEKNLPGIILWKNREVMDKFYDRETEKWLKGSSEGNNIFVLNRKSFDRDADYRFTSDRYLALVKHELCHQFLEKSSQIEKPKPIWLDEGLAIVLANQLNKDIQIKKFSIVLEYYNKFDKRVYNESGALINLLIKKFGKVKLLKLIKSLKNITGEKEFYKKFKQIYGFELNYKEINKCFQQQV